MEHYRNPRNRGNLVDADMIRRGNNPRCGDDIEVAVKFAGDSIGNIMFRGRGCSVCLASASMMTETVDGMSKQQAHELAQAMQAWFNADGDNPAVNLQALEAVHGHTARKRCVLLAWEALVDALDAE